MKGNRITTKLDTHTFFQVSVGLLLVLCWVDDSFGGRICKKGFRYIEGANKSAICEKCECRAGFEWDKSVKLKRLKGFGFTECYPCVRCPDGKYRVGNSLTNRCSKCQRNCTNENKFVAEPCGGTTAGYCGNCFLGFKMDSIDHNSRCVPDKTVHAGCAAGHYHDGESCVACSLNCSAQHRVVAERCGGVSRGSCGTCQPGFTMTTTEKCLPESPDTNLREKNSGNQSQKPKMDNTLMTIIVSSIVLVAVACLLLIGNYARKKCKKRTSNTSNRSYIDAKGCTQSASKLIHSGTTLGEDYNDLETDGPKGRVRGELPLCIPIDTHIQDILDRHSYTRFSLEMNKTVANNISGDGPVLRFFDTFPIKKTFVDPERDFWLHGIHDFSDYVFNVLKRWMEAKGKDATLDKVCSALHDADFSHVVPMLMHHVTDVRPELSKVSNLSTAAETDTNSFAGKGDHARQGDNVVLMKKGISKKDTVGQAELVLLIKDKDERVEASESVKPTEKGTANKENTEPSESVKPTEQGTANKEHVEPSECTMLMEQDTSEKEDTEISECSLLMEQDACIEEPTDSSEHMPC